MLKNNRDRKPLKQLNESNNSIKISVCLIEVKTQERDSNNSELIMPQNLKLYLLITGI